MAKVPARLIEGIAVRLDEDGIWTTVHLDTGGLDPITSDVGDPDTHWTAVWVSTLTEIRRATPFGFGVETTISREQVMGKPDTFPPTLPMVGTDVAGLPEALTGIAAVDNGQDGRLAVLQAAIDALEDRVTVNTPLGGADARTPVSYRHVYGARRQE